MADATLYLIFEDVGSVPLTRFEYVGGAEADNAEHALRVFYKEPPSSTRTAVAVASSRWQPRPVKAREPKTTLGAALAMPTNEEVAEIAGQETLLPRENAQDETSEPEVSEPAVA